MNTPAHLIIGAAVFARPDARLITAAALLGALAPDLSLYLLVAWELLVVGTEPRVVFGEYYFSDAWQAIFAVDNSLILWGALLGVAVWLKRHWLVAFAGSGFLHLLADFPLHHDDARRHFWPLSDWVFESPLSYWDSRHYGNIIGPLEIALTVILLLILWRRFTGLWPRIVIILAGLVQVAPGLIWRLVF